jgi:hypothetical protein
MQRRRVLFLVCVACIVMIGWLQSKVTHAQKRQRAQEEVAVFSVCGQAADAATGVQSKVNTWLDDHRTARVLQQEMPNGQDPSSRQYFRHQP